MFHKKSGFVKALKLSTECWYFIVNKRTRTIIFVNQNIKINEKYKKIVEKNSKILKIPIIEIGYVTSGKGVFVEEVDDLVRLKDLGWKHFR